MKASFPLPVPGSLQNGIFSWVNGIISWVNGIISLFRWMYCDMDFSQVHRQGGVEVATESLVLQSVGKSTMRLHGYP
jgi:hypothetical protein